MGKRTGRPRQTRERRKDGRLVPLIDKGNDRVQQRREGFKVFQGGKANQQIHDPIGRAWAAGLLTGNTQDAAILRDVGRRYAALHSIVYSRTAVKVGGIEREPFGTGEGNWNDPDPIGVSLTKLDTAAKRAGSKQYLAMRKLCVECSPDENPPWLARLIDHSAWKARCAFYETQAGAEADAFRALPQPPVPMERDRMILDQATAALVAMVEGTKRLPARFAA